MRHEIATSPLLAPRDDTKDLLSVTRFPRSIITAERLLGMLAQR